MPATKQVSISVDLAKLLEAGVHFGHQARRWYPKMAPYIWQAREGVHIFDLIKTAECLVKAQEALKQDIKEGKTIVFVGTKRQAASIVEEEAKRAGVPYIVSRWAGGTLTNWPQVKRSLDRLSKLKKGLTTGEFNHYTKKERVLLDREMNRLERLFGGLEGLQEPPQTLFIVDITREKAAIRESKVTGVKTYAIVDSNANPDMVDYPIPGNDDAVRSIKLLVSALADAIIEAKSVTEKKVEEKKADEKAAKNSK